jgi:hypothetical protein
MREKRREGNMVFFDFICPGCDAQGELGLIPAEGPTVGCPEGCGSTFYLWQPSGGLYSLRCVVQRMELQA